MLLGESLEGMQAWDVRCAIAGIRSINDLASAPLVMRGAGDLGAGDRRHRHRGRHVGEDRVVEHEQVSGQDVDAQLLEDRAADGHRQDVGRSRRDPGAQQGDHREDAEERDDQAAPGHVDQGAGEGQRGCLG